MKTQVSANNEACLSGSSEARPSHTQHIFPPWKVVTLWQPHGDEVAVTDDFESVVATIGAAVTGKYVQDGIQASARLIAAAPELLEACLALRAMLEESQSSLLIHPNMGKANAAIAKATGENLS